MKQRYEDIYPQIYDEFVRIAQGAAVPSVRDLMRRYGVSQSTISRVLDQLRLQKVIETRPGARSVRTMADGSSAKDMIRVTFAMSDYPSSFGAVIRDAFERRFSQPPYRFNVVFFHNSDSLDRSLKVDPACDFLIMNMNLDLNPGFIRNLLDFNGKAIFLDTVLSSVQFDSVCADNELGGAMAAHYFLRSNSKRAAMMLALPSTHNSRARYRGFAREMKLHGKECVVIDCATKPGENSTANAYEAFRRYVKEHGLDFDGLFCDGDLGALGVLKAANELNIAIPETLEIIGFDNIAEGKFFHPALTSVDQNIERWAEAVEEIITEYRSGKKTSPYQTYIEPELIFRESTRAGNR